MHFSVAELLSRGTKSYKKHQIEMYVVLCRGKNFIVWKIINTSRIFIFCTQFRQLPKDWQVTTQYIYKQRYRLHWASGCKCCESKTIHSGAASCTDLVESLRFNPTPVLFLYKLKWIDVLAHKQNYCMYFISLENWSFLVIYRKIPH